MTRSLFSRISAAVLLLTITAWSVTAHRPAVFAAPASDKISAASPNTAVSLASLLSGKVYPSTLKAAQIDSAFQMVDLVDTQGKPGTYATRSETATVGSETFLVAYFVVADAGQPATTTIPPGSTLHLALINMHYVQAMTNPRPAVAAR